NPTSTIGRGIGTQTLGTPLRTIVADTAANNSAPPYIHFFWDKPITLLRLITLSAAAGAAQQRTSADAFGYVIRATCCVIHGGLPCPATALRAHIQPTKITTPAALRPDNTPAT